MQFRSGASNLTYLLQYPGQELVLRRPPVGTKAISAHDMKREYLIQSRLKPSYDLVPKTNILGTQGEGFALAQARLGPGRIHHCMRAIGMAERALSLMIKRTVSREAFGKELVKQGVIQEWIAQARIDIEPVSYTHLTLPTKRIV